MQYSIEISDKAERDTEQEIDYYFAVSVDLAYRFRDELHDVYDKIKGNPLLYKYLFNKKWKTLRCAGLKSFPYLVIYRIKGNDVIIISVFNTYRKPVYGQP